MEWLIFSFVMQMAYLPNESLAMYENAREVEERCHMSFYCDLQPELLFFEHLFIGGNIRANFFKYDNTVGEIRFIPDQMNFKFTAGIRFDIIEVGFRHYCIHPLVPYMSNQFNGSNILWEGAYEEVYFQISGTTAKNKK